MKTKKKLLILALLSTFICGCNIVYDQEDVIRELKKYDDTSPYTYSFYDENISYEFVYNEGTEKFSCYCEYWNTTSSGIIESSVTITWVWGYLQDADVIAFYSDTSYYPSATIKMDIRDFSFGLFPAIDTIDYYLTYISDGATDIDIESAEDFAMLLMESALEFANIFCTDIHGSLSIR